MLYGVDSRNGDHDRVLHDLLRSTSSTVVLMHWEDRPPAVESALACGAHGTASKSLPAGQLLEAIEQIARVATTGARPPSTRACTRRSAAAA